MKLTIQLYTVRNEMEKDLRGTLEAIAKTGLKYVEGGGMSPEKAKEFKSILDDNGLSFSGGHVSPDAIESDLGSVVEAFNILGSKTVICPWIPASNFESPEAVGAFADRLNSAGEKLRAEGFTWLYHNHDFEFTNKVEGTYGLEKLMELTDPNNLGFEVDVAWVKIGGADPIEFLTKNASRVKLLHLKDFDPAKTPRWTVAGDGTVDFDSIIKWGQDNNIPFGAVELDESPGEPLDAVAGSVAYFFSKGVEA